MTDETNNDNIENLRKGMKEQEKLFGKAIDLLKKKLLKEQSVNEFEIFEDYKTILKKQIVQEFSNENHNYVVDRTFKLDFNILEQLEIYKRFAELYGIKETIRFLAVQVSELEHDAWALIKRDYKLGDDEYYSYSHVTKTITVYKKPSKSKDETEEAFEFTAPCPVCEEDTVQKIIRNATYCYKHTDFLTEPDKEE